MVLLNKILKKSVLVGAVFGALALTPPAFAATLSIVGGTADVLPGNFNPAPGSGGAAPGDPIVTFSAGVDGGSIGGGLSLSAPSTVRFTFLGKEAGATNNLVELSSGGALFLNSDTSSAGDFIDVADDGGFVDFLFNTDNLGGLDSIWNGGIADDTRLSLAFKLVSATEAIAFLGDGAGDNDYDDMVIRIQAIPLPASLLLLLSGVAGLGYLRRRIATA